MQSASFTCENLLCSVMLWMINKAQNQRENLSFYWKSPLRCRILTGIIINIYAWIRREKKGPHKDSLPCHWGRQFLVWCGGGREAGALCAVFPVTRIAAVCRKETNVRKVGDRFGLCNLHVVIVYMHGPYMITEVAVLLKQYCMVWL